MLIVGAKGFATELLQSLPEDNLQSLVFFDDVSQDNPEKLYEQYPILKTKEEAKKYFSTVSQHFTLGLGNSSLRKKLYSQFIKLGGIFKGTTSKIANVGSYTNIKEGCNILAGAHISNGVTIGRGALIYYNVIITHDVQIGDFAELSPGCKILGRVQIGNQVQVGSGAIILPDLKIGENVVIGAGAVVTKDVEANSVVIGNPARKLKNKRK
ncbi:NeuD/PglB/VioB family sugar acetyltransferase [Haloflavibacter putidus]|uniref:Hexapeptide transferase n=1 Tax=Haloflavibacter putidus TaxID=2576776 RepID=A0A507Z9S1_9FLAO|nr:NeuD/PglB/VioB family sugar acetyltransferase [Haloflavibacter putidus]TQD33809.1 hexapeptide transferase [Haloflavibacter putidus]